VTEVSLPTEPSWVKTTYVFTDDSGPIVRSNDERHRMRVQYVTITEFPNGEPSSADVEGWVVTKSGAKDKRYISAGGDHEATRAFLAAHQARGATS
jgi:hypothetical protein